MYIAQMRENLCQMAEAGKKLLTNGPHIFSTFGRECTLEESKAATTPNNSCSSSSSIFKKKTRKSKLTFAQ